MKLQVSIANSSRGVTEYGICPYRKSHRYSSATIKELRKLKKLMPRIERMARAQIGKSFKSVIFLDGYGLLLNVKVGTSKGPKKFEFRSLLGWIELYDAVPKT